MEEFRKPIEAIEPRFSISPRWLLTWVLCVMLLCLSVLHSGSQPRAIPASEPTHLADVPPPPQATLITGGLSPDPPAWFATLPSSMTSVYYPVLNGTEGYINKGHEAMFYLTYIVTHYDTLPEYMVFVHNHERAWHNSDTTDRSIIKLLSDLQWDFVAQRGYVNLRCQRQPNCPRIRALSGLLVTSGKMQSFFEDAWRVIFQQEFGPLKQVAAPCCAQFAVTRFAVHARRIEFYQHIISWLWESDGTDWQLGRVLEYTWHIIFGRPFVDCSDVAECRRNLYGYVPGLL